jgi:hypothetical protein
VKRLPSNWSSTPTTPSSSGTIKTGWRWTRKLTPYSFSPFVITITESTPVWSTSDAVPIPSFTSSFKVGIESK